MQTTTTHITGRSRPFVASAVVITTLLLAIAPQVPAASRREAADTAFTQTRTVAHRAEVRRSYGWPVKPFNRQHPVRGYLNDPRNADGTKNFHFGIDISAADGT